MKTQIAVVTLMVVALDGIGWDCLVTCDCNLCCNEDIVSVRDRILEFISFTDGGYLQGYLFLCYAEQKY